MTGSHFRNMYMKSLAMNCWCPRKSISLYFEALLNFRVSCNTTTIPQELNLLRSERLFRLLCISLEEFGLFRDCAKTHSFLKRKKQSWWCEEFILWMIQCRKHLSSIAGLAEKTVMLLKFYPRPWRNNYRSLTTAELQLQPALCVCRKW